ncbi:Short chain dehydrogenase-like protein 45 [Elsinoe fawcettii]|nr:Short chain dehydrogenase-like protein 45 [Elsinoe fawcettii]
MAAFNPEKDIPDLSGKVILVTGGTAGLGRETVTSLAKTGTPHVIFTGRNAKSAQVTIDAAKAINSDAKVEFVECDLTDLKTVKATASNVKSKVHRLDYLFANAGIMATPAALSKDGFEIQFATNHLGHAMLVEQLLPVLQKTADTPNGDVRVIFTTSLGYQFASSIGYDTIRTKQEAYILGAFRRYGQSKLANLLYPKALARKYPSITFVSIHPGVINTALISGLSTFNKYFTHVTTFHQQVTVQEGVKNQIWAAMAPKSKVDNGAFYEPVGQPGRMTAAGKDEKLADELYEWTKKTLKDY